MRLFLIALGIFFSFFAYGQDSTFVTNLSLNASGSTGPTPFWAHANKNGSIPYDKFFVSGQWGIYKIYNPNDPRILQWSGGAELITNYGKKGDAFFTDLYVAGRLGPVELLAGQKKSIVGLIDSTLGSGSLSISGNARPYPKLQLAIPDFLPLVWTNDILSVKASISEGFLGPSTIGYGSVRKVSRNYFHQKQLYFRIGRARSDVKAYLGINHQALWGGEDEIRPNDSPGQLQSYWYVFSGKDLSHRKVGSHFGTIDLGADFKLKKWKVLIYRNNVYESGSLFKILNIYDGLNGITVTNTKVKRLKPRIFSLHSFNIEYLFLKNQSNQFQSTGSILYAIANYYNSYIYQRGFSYYTNSLGSPLVPSATSTAENLPRNASQFTNNNRVQAFHTAIKGYSPICDLLLKATYSRNFGASLTPFGSSKDQLSVMLNGERRIRLLGETTLSVGLFSDFGKLYPKSNGVMLGVRRSAFIN